MDGLFPNIPGKLQERARSRTYQEALRRAQEVVGPDEHLLKSYGEELLEIKRSNSKLVDGLKKIEC
jgi:hypothetical protein